MGTRRAVFRRFVCFLGLLGCLWPFYAFGQTAPAISIVLTATPDPVAPGGTVLYKIALANPSASTATGAIAITGTLPQYVAVTQPTPGSICANFSPATGCRFGQALKWNVASIAPGESTYFQFAVAVDNSTANPAPADGTTLTMLLQLTLGANTLQVSTDVLVGSSPLDLAISSDPGRVPAGGAVTYTLGFGNAGSVAVPATLSVPVPAGTTFVSATGSGTQSGGAVQWDLGTLAPGFSDQRQFTVTVGGGIAAGTLLLAKAQLLNRGTQASLIREATTNLVAPSALLSVTLTATPDPVEPGGVVLYRIRVANSSANTATGAYTLTANVPQSVSVTETMPQATCANFSPANGCRFGEMMSWNMASLAPGDSSVLQYEVAVDNSTSNPAPPDGSVLFADVTASAFGGVRVGGAVFVGNGSHLNLAVSGTPDRVAPGASITYTLAFGNPGTAATSARLTMPLAAGTTFVSATGGGVASAGSVQWDLGMLSPGAADQRQVTVATAGSLSAGALVTAQPQLVDPATGQTLVRAATTNLVATSALLSLSIAGTPDPTAPGAVIVYKIRIANLSSNTPTGTYSLQANVPPFASVAGTTPQATCANFSPATGCRFGEPMYWNMPTLAPGDSTYVQFALSVDNSASNPPPADGTVLFGDLTASAFGGVRTTDTVFVNGGSRLGLTLGGAPDRVAPGAMLTYTVGIGNTAAAGTPALLTVGLPDNTTFVSATGGGIATNGVVQWDLGTVAAGAADTRQLTVGVGASAPAGALVVAEAQLLDPATRVTRAREWATSLVATQSLVSLALSTSPTDVQPGGSVVYQIQIANLSPNTATGTFTLSANVPRFTAVAGTSPQATCANFTPATGCRFGENMVWNVPSIAAGGNTVLQFTVSVDNTAANPAPPTGTLLFADATALVFGTVRASTYVFVGNVTPIEPGDSGVGVGQGSGDAGLDAGDAGSPDATVESDASIDAGDDGGAHAADASNADTGSSGADASVAADGGASGSDASSSGADAGMASSTGSGSTSNGCSCTTAGSESTGTLPWLLAGALGFATLRRRRPRARRL